MNCSTALADSTAKGDNSIANADACGSSTNCLNSVADAKASKGGSADSNACVSTTGCGGTTALTSSTVKARDGTADVTVLGFETGKASAHHGGTAIVTPTGVSCSGHAHAKL